MRYIPFVQQPYCCVPANLQMVMYRRGLALMSQEDIGYGLGLTVPPKDHFAVPGARVSNEPPTTAGWGTQIQNDNYGLNKFFADTGLPLQFEFVPTYKVGNHRSWVQEQIDADNDVICCFNYQVLYGEGGNNGHVCVVEEVDDHVTALIDPAATVPKRRRVDNERLTNSMKLHGVANSGGYWLITSTSR